MDLLDRIRGTARILSRAPAGDFVMARQIAQQLGVSIKVVYRDLQFMRDRLGLPIQSDKESFGAKEKPGQGYRFSRRVPLCARCSG